MRLKNNRKAMKTSFLLIILVFVIACSPLDRDYNPKTVKEDLKTLREIGVPEYNVLLLEGYIKGQNMNDLDIDSTLTYEELLEVAKTEKMRLEMNWYINNLSKTLKQNREEKSIDSLNSFFTMTLMDKSYDGDAFKDYISIELNITNKSKANLKGLKGILIFYDLFGDVLKKSEIKCDIALPAGQSILFNARLPFNTLIDKDIELYQMDKSQFTIKFIPSEILFSDGKKISASQ
jgi:hypothetical protein